MGVVNSADIRGPHISATNDQRLTMEAWSVSTKNDLSIVFLGCRMVSWSVTVVTVVTAVALKR